LRAVDAPAAVGQKLRVADPLRIGVSACLLGQKVRYDGRHKLDAPLLDELAPFVTFVPVCPEVEVGMGVPREPVRLVRGEHGRTLMIGGDSGADWTERMDALAARRVEELAVVGIAGFVLKARSPSCGLAGVELHDAGAPAQAPPAREGVGLFARALLARLPGLPIEEDERLHDERARTAFLERASAYARARLP
jgi:uncharacterized protein YbbK (DUF523 family)